MNISLTTNDGRSIPLNAIKTVIGREADCDIMVDVSVVSRRHVVISNENGAAYITDLGSANGTTVNGERLLPNGKRQLSSGDRVVLATKVSFTVMLEENATSVLPQTPRRPPVPSAPMDRAEETVINKPAPISPTTAGPFPPPAQAPISPTTAGPFPPPAQAPISPTMAGPFPMPAQAPISPTTAGPFPPSAPTPAPAPMTPPPARQTQPPMPPIPRKKKKKRFPVLPVVGAALLLAAIAVACVLLFVKPKATKNVEELIDAIGTVTLESKDAILEARAAYDELTEKELKKLENGDVLEEAEKAIRKCGWDDVVKKVGGEWKSILTLYGSREKGLKLVSEKTFEGTFKNAGKSGTWTVNGGEEHWKEADKVILDLGTFTLELKKEGNYDILYDEKNSDVYVRAAEYEKYFEEHFKILDLSSEETDIDDIVVPSTEAVIYCENSPHHYNCYGDVASGETKVYNAEVHVAASKLYEEGWVLISEQDVEYRVFLLCTVKNNYRSNSEFVSHKNETLFGGCGWMKLDTNLGECKEEFMFFGDATGMAAFVKKEFVDRVEYDDDSNSHTVYMTNGAAFRVESEYHTENCREY